jgi:hypothetical protein
MAQLGRRHSCCNDLGIHSPDERVPTRPIG